MIRFPLARLLAGRPARYLALTVLWNVVRASALATGLLLQAFFDVLGGHAAGGPTVWLLLALIVASEAFRVSMWYGAILSRAEPPYTYQVRSGLRDNVLSNLLRRPAAVALDRPAGDVVSRVSGDCDEVGVFAIWSASNVSRLVAAVAALVIMLTVDPLVAVGLIGPVVVVTLAGRALNGPVGRYRLAAREAAAEVSTVVGEAVGGIQSIKSARAEGRVVDRLVRAGEHRRRVAVREEVLVSFQGFLFRSTGAFGTGLVLVLAAGKLRAGTFTVGDLALFVFYIQIVADAVNALGMFFGRVKQADLSLGRLAELTNGMAAATRSGPTYLDRELPAEAPGAPHQPLVSLSAVDLTCRYPGSDRGVRGANLTITPGTLTVVTGPVGAGKSTFVKAILGMVPLERGEIRWNGEPVSDPGAFFVPPRAGYVPQTPHLFSGTLRENLVLGRDCREQRLLDALRLAALVSDL
ncbi:ABC transporter transmembrane domain-containing protein [Actinophytocola sp.]|uniref:ABC transporter transmembrane domain-containing protein n=1 Tax=Actinophytocola sp. TaxID=1872138 RepID=UPI00389A3DCA